MNSLTKGNLQGRRWLGTAVLLAVFLLPFHIHFYNPNPPVDKNCACFSGVQSQNGPVRVATVGAPPRDFVPVPVEDYRFFDLLSPRLHFTRAPPAL